MGYNVYWSKVEDAQPDGPDEEGDDELDLDDLLDIEIEEEEEYICGVDTTYYLCPKCHQFTLEKSCCGLWD